MRQTRATSLNSVIGLCIGLQCVASALAPAQQGAGSPRSTFAERVEVRVINLEAVVVDRRGRRVRGLQPRDFVLEVDGKPAPIEYFSEIADGLAVASAAEPETELPAAAPAVAPPGEPVATSYLVFIDSYFTRLAGRRNRVLREIEDNLARLGPEDRMAIVAFDGRKLAVLSSWSRSTETLADALEVARSLPARGLITGNLAAELDRGIGIEEGVAAAIAQQESARVMARPPAQAPARRSAATGCRPTSASRSSGWRGASTAP